MKLEHELSLEELDSIIDQILSEQDIELDETLIEKIINEDTLEENLSDAMTDFLKSFDKKANDALQKKTLELIAKKHNVDPEELKKVSGL